MSFKDTLQDWTDWDVASFVLGRSLGLFLDGEFLDYKGNFWTSNPLGHGLFRTLVDMSDQGLLEFEDEQFKWKGL